MARSEIRDFAREVEEAGDEGEEVLESCLDRNTLESAFAALPSLEELHETLQAVRDARAALQTAKRHCSGNQVAEIEI